MVDGKRRIGPSRTTATALIWLGATFLAPLSIALVDVVRAQNANVVGQPLERLSPVERQEGARLFRNETFGGNGRTCETCHSRSTGTLSPDDVQQLLRKEPSNPLFLHDGLDDGVSGTSRIADHSGRPKALNTKSMQLMLIGSTTCAIIRIRPLASS